MIRYMCTIVCLTFYCLSSIQCQESKGKILEARKIKITKTDGQTIQMKCIRIQDSSLSYKEQEMDITIPYDVIQYIHIRKGSNFPKLLMYSSLFGVGYGVVYGLFAVPMDIIKNTFLGLSAGLIAAVIVAPFVRKEEQLIFYKGKWTDPAYSP